MDILRKATEIYNTLLNMEYTIIIGKNKRLLAYQLVFEKDYYKHLFGLHKLKDMTYIYTRASSRLFRDVMSGKITVNDICASSYYPEIANRINHLINLEKCLDNVTDLVIWNRWRSPISVISADIMLVTPPLSGDDKETFIFFLKQTEKPIHISYNVDQAVQLTPVTSFANSQDYRQGQERPLNIMYIEKYNRSNQRSIVLLDKLSGQNNKIFQQSP